MTRNTIHAHMIDAGHGTHAPVTFGDLLALADRQAEADRERTPAELKAEADRQAREARAAELRAEAERIERGEQPSAA